jgi:hypothetical protein
MSQPAKDYKTTNPFYIILSIKMPKLYKGKTLKYGNDIHKAYFCFNPFIRFPVRTTATPRNIKLKKPTF